MSDATYRQAVMSSGPQAYWPLADPVGSPVAAELVAAWSGLVRHTVAFGTPDPFGAHGAAAFDGSTGYIVDPAYRPNAARVPFSIECWYQTGADAGTMVEANYSQADGPSGTYGPSLYIQTGQLRGFVFGGATNYITDPSPTNDGGWHHAVLTYDALSPGAGNMTLYRDGKQVAITNQADRTSGFPGYWRQGHGAVQGYLAGNLAHVAVYAKALSANDVARHFAAAQAVPPPPGGACIRQAWLTLPNGQRVDLEGPGYFCQKLDLGSPAVRENANNRPDRSGVLDQTSLLGARAVEATITALVGAGARIDEVASQFGPFMDPALRPTLHYVLDRGDNPERTLVLRASAYSWPIIGDNQRDVQLQWSAPDPIARGVIDNRATAWSGIVGASGRVYPWTPDRVYPVGSGAPTSGRLISPGDLPFSPYLRIFGPITAPRVVFAPDIGSTDRTTWPQIGFAINFVIDAGRFVGIDTERHTAYLDDNPALPVLDRVDWTLLGWPVLDPEPNGWTMTLSGTSGMTNTTQVQATWHDRYFA